MRQAHGQFGVVVAAVMRRVESSIVVPVVIDVAFAAS